MTPEVIAVLSGAVFSFVLELFPFIRDAWDKVSFRYKPLVVFAVCLAVPLAISGLSCANIAVGIPATCPATGQAWWDLAYLGFLAFVSSQGTFKLVARDNGVKFLYGDLLKASRGTPPTPPNAG